jgi:hypothetical protein
VSSDKDLMSAYTVQYRNSIVIWQLPPRLIKKATRDGIEMSSRCQFKHWSGPFSLLICESSVLLVGRLSPHALSPSVKFWGRTSRRTARCYPRICRGHICGANIYLNGVLGVLKLEWGMSIGFRLLGKRMRPYGFGRRYSWSFHAKCPGRAN